VAGAGDPVTLLDMQRALSRMLTDQEFRRTFRAGHPAALQGYRLTERERDCLLALRWDRVALHAELHGYSRMSLGLKALPCSHLAIGDRVTDLVDRYCAEYPPAPEAGGAAVVEAERVGEFLTRLVDAGSLGPAWLGDLLRYEQALLRVGSTYRSWESARRVAELGGRPSERLDGVPVAGPHVTVLAFDHPVLDLVADLEAARVPGPVPPLGSPLWLMLSKAPDSLVRTAQTNEATAELIRACDGRRTVSEVVSLLSARLGGAVGAAVLAILDQLAAWGVVGVTTR
jgi:hypothetical protein